MVLNSHEKLVWSISAPNSIKASPAYFWAQVVDLAKSKVGQSHNVYHGDHWYKLVIAKAEEILTELGVEWERHCGDLYIAGKRIWWNSNQGKWCQDDYRP